MKKNKRKYHRGLEQGKREERQRVKEVAGSIAWVSEEPSPQVTAKTKRIYNRALEDLCRAIDYIDDYCECSKFEDNMEGNGICLKCFKPISI